MKTFNDNFRIITKKEIKFGHSFRSSLIDLKNFLRSNDTITLDVETAPLEEFRNDPRGGLNPHLSRIIMLQIGNDEVQYAVDTRDFTKEEIQSVLSIIVENPYAKVCGQNIKFDYKMLLSNYGIRLNAVWDTMVVEQILHCGKFNYGYSLEKLAERYLNFKYAKTNQLDLFGNNNSVGVLSKALRKTFKNQGDKPFIFDQFRYGCKDVAHTHSVYLKQLEKLVEWDLYFLATVENQFVKSLAEMEYNGMYLSDTLWTKQYEKNYKEFTELRDQIFKIIREEGLEQFYDFQMSLFVNPEDFQAGIDINLSSHLQVVELCKALDIPTKILDKKKSKERHEDVFKDTVEERFLKKYKDRHPIVPLYLRYKRAEKAVSTYGKNFLEQLNPITRRLHSDYKQILVTGRIASRNPNLQNIPSEEKFPGFRTCFISPEGWSLIVNDYSAQESRILAELSNDDALVDFFLNGDGDLHSFTARRMFKVEVRKSVEDADGNIIVEGKNEHLRSLAKILNFGIA